MASINNEIKNVEEKRLVYNKLFQKADNDIKIDRINAEFDFINKELQSIDNLNSIAAIRTAITNLFDSVQKKEKIVIANIINSFYDFFKDFDSKDIIIESIDFSAIESEATNSKFLCVRC